MSDISFKSKNPTCKKHGTHDRWLWFNPRTADEKAIAHCMECWAEIMIRNGAEAITLDEER